MTDTPKRLWDKGGSVDAQVHAFTVGDDPFWDGFLVAWDCRGSAAHARTLHRAKLLDDADLARLLAALSHIEAEHAAGRFVVAPELEDCHTAIENALTERLGDAGRRIHTGRSRNDQVATAMRLFLRDAALGWGRLLDEFAAAGLARIARDGAIPLPGYTHMQRAMPSSVGQWLHALVEGAIDELRGVCGLLERLDACPLGTGAGFGVPLPLDRAYTAQLLGFSRVQRSPIDVQNSRGRVERVFLASAVGIGALVEKLSWDLILYTMSELGFAALPERFTTGSSIMPQKRNPDVLELCRAHGARLRGAAAELEWVAGKLPSSYHRDLQLTKGPTIRAAGDAATLLRIATSVIGEVRFDVERCRAAMSDELFATHAALERVAAGVPWRDAYREIAAAVSSGTFDATPFRERGTASAAIAPADLDAAAREAAAVRTQLDRRREGVDAAMSRVYEASDAL